MTSQTTAFAHVYGVELLYPEPPRLWKPRVLESIRRRCPSAEPLAQDHAVHLLAVVHPTHRIQLKDAEIPAQHLIQPLDSAPKIEALKPAIQQSWRFRDAASAAGTCKAAVLVADLMSSGLQYKERLALFQQVLAAVLEVAPPRTIHWRPAEQFVPPKEYLEAVAEGGERLFFTGAVNVRFYNVDQSNGQMLCDTLGLAALGLPDIQCHFQGLEPNDVVRVLYNTALYIFDNGDVVNDGQTVTGHSRWTKWRAQHEVALAPPEREVLDLNPGPKYAAGRGE